MNDFAKMQLIEAYHSQQLDTAQQSQFDELYLSDMDFAKQVEDFKPIFEGFEMLHLEAFERQIQTWEAAHHQSDTQPKTATLTATQGGRWRKILIYAAAAAILIVAPVVYFQTQTQTFTYILPAAWQANKCEIVAFVHNKNEGNKFDILQAAQKKVK